MHIILKTLAILSFIIFTGCCHPNKQLEYNIIGEQYRNSVGIIFDTDGRKGVAFPVSNRHFLTTGHFCQTKDPLDYKLIMIHRLDSTANMNVDLEDLDNLILTDMLTIHPKYDLCVITTRTQHNFPVFDITDIDLKIGDQVLFSTATTLGYKVFAYRESYATVVNPGFKDKSLFVIDKLVYHGDSGSPIIKNGKVIGMVIAFFANKPGLSLVIHGHILKDWNLLIQEEFNNAYPGNNQ